jgi:putative nucleotidyltransferase with HDIG domain
MSAPTVRDLLTRAEALERTGEWTAAAAAYEQAFRGALAGRDAAALREIVTKQGHCFRQAGDTEAAGELLELAHAVAVLACDDAHAARALNGLAIMLMQRGDVAAAEPLYRRALRAALAAGDERVVGEIEQNLGVICTMRGDVPAALGHYQAGLLHLRRTGNARGEAGVLANLGVLHVNQGELDQADAYFRESLDVCARIGDVVTTGNVHLNRAEMFLARGEPDQARASCDEAYEIFGRLGEPERQAETMRTYGVIHRVVGKLHLAENYLRQAIRTAAEARFPYVEADSHRELARVLRSLNRNREALEALNRAHGLYVGLQAQHHQADINARIEELENDFLTLVRFWGESIEAKDRYTSGHCERVAEYACRLAGEAGVGEREMVWFRMGAFLHDLGKTEVPEEILNKPGRLTDDERSTMERHTVIGDEMLAPVEFPWDIRPMVRSHHERWDGRGYPDGLSGRDIPLAARILRIADVFDALTTARSYRRPLTPDEAMAIMEEDTGSFDPDIFAIFREIFPELVGRAEEAQRMATR